MNCATPPFLKDSCVELRQLGRATHALTTQQWVSKITRRTAASMLPGMCAHQNKLTSSVRCPHASGDDLHASPHVRHATSLLVRFCSTPALFCLLAVTHHRLLVPIPASVHYIHWRRLCCAGPCAPSALTWGLWNLWLRLLQYQAAHAAHRMADGSHQHRIWSLPVAGLTAAGLAPDLGTIADSKTRCWCRQRLLPPPPVHAPVAAAPSCRSKR